MPSNSWKYLQSSYFRSQMKNALKAITTQETIVTLMILLLTTAAYCQVATFRFVTFDDPVYITRNAIILKGLTKESIRFAFSSGIDGNYLPLVWLSHAACVSIFKTWAGGHHLVNLLLHVANSILLFHYLRKLTQSLWPSAAIALLFALHPLHVESVAWVSERKDVLSTFFWILTSWAFLCYTEKPSTWRYLWMLTLFILGLLSKSMLVTLPVTLFLFDIWPLRRLTVTDKWDQLKIKRLFAFILEKAPLLALSFGFSLITFLMQKNAGAMTTLTGFPLFSRLGNALLGTTTYLQQTFFPCNLSVFYPISGPNAPVWRILTSALVILAITGYSIWSFPRRSYLLVGWLWYGITLLPVIGIIQVGGQAHADRYTYVPLIGIFIMLAFLARDIISHYHIHRRLLVIISACILACLLTLTAAQTFTWRDNLTLFKNALSFDATNPVALINIGDEYLERGQIRNALSAYTEALKYSKTLYLGHYRVGYSLDLLGQNEQALYFYGNTMRLKPDFMGGKQKTAHLLTRMKRYDEATPYIKEILQMPDPRGTPSDPLDPRISYVDWALIQASKGNYSEATQILTSVLDKSPALIPARLAFGITLHKMGYTNDAYREIRTAANQKPLSPEQLYQIESAYLSVDCLSEAKQMITQLQETNPESTWLRRGQFELNNYISARH